MKYELSHNGELLTDNTGLVNRALLFGDGFFESFRMLGGRILFWEQHKARIREAAKILRINLDEKLIGEIEQSIYQLYESNDKKVPTRGRLTVYRKGAGLYSPDVNDAEYVIQLFEIEKEQFVLNKQGLLVDLFTFMQKPVNQLSSFKTLNALPFVMAGIEKKDRNLDDVLILNSSNRLCESSTSNVFCVKGDVLLTPASSEGCVNGVMRAVILEHAPEAGMNVKETSLTTLDLYECDELLLTNAARGIQWIMGFRNKRYFNRVSGKLVQMLNDLVK